MENLVKDLREGLNTCKKLAKGAWILCGRVEEALEEQGVRECKLMNFTRQIKDVAIRLTNRLTYAPIFLHGLRAGLEIDVKYLNLPCYSGVRAPEPLADALRMILKVQEWLDFAGDDLYQLPEITDKYEE